MLLLLLLRAGISSFELVMGNTPMSRRMSANGHLPAFMYYRATVWCLSFSERAQTCFKTVGWTHTKKAVSIQTASRVLIIVKPITIFLPHILDRIQKPIQVLVIFQIMSDGIRLL